MKTALSRQLIWLTLLGIGAFFLLVGTNLANFPPVSSDEIWILNISYNLLVNHVFGSDLFEGIFHADTHYFFNLPVYHFLQAGIFRLAGIGIWQARFLGVLSGLILLLTVTWAVWQWFDAQTAFLTAGFILFWRSNLIGIPPGIPLVAGAHNGRYDLLAVTFMWLSLSAFSYFLDTKSRWVGFMAGLFAGLGAITQFFGVFVVPIIGILWIYQNRENWYRLPATYFSLSGLFIALSPYVVFIFTYYEDFLGQTLLMKASRVEIGNIAFYVQNLWGEAQRYHGLLTAQTPSSWMIFPAIAGYVYLYLPNAFLTKQQTGILILKGSTLLLLLQLALLEQTKAPLYSIILFPTLCILLALFINKILVEIANKSGDHLIRGIQKGVVGTIWVVIFLEGGIAYSQYWQAAQNVSPYEEVGQQIAAHIPPGARVAGMIRWWWAFHPQPFITTGSQWLRWRIAEQTTQKDGFHQIFAEDEIEYVLVTKNVREYIVYQPKELETQYWQFIEACTLPIKSWTDKTYRQIEIYKVEWMLPTCKGSTPP